MSILTLFPDHLELIRREGERHYPEECCGFLFGLSLADAGREPDERLIGEVIPIRNEQHANRARRFLITPEEFRHAEEYARRTGKDLLGFYHTHPDHPAIPSEFDREHALPFYSYIILSVCQGKAAEIRSWQLELDRTGYTEETMTLIAEAAS